MSAVPIASGEPLAPVRCATWCADGTGHTRQTHVEDQYCYSAAIEMAATLHDSHEDFEDVAVYVRKESDEDTPYVVVRTPQDTEMRLTAGEVRSLVGSLEHMAWVARQDAGQQNAFQLGRDLERGLKAEQ